MTEQAKDFGNSFLLLFASIGLSELHTIAGTISFLAVAVYHIHKTIKSHKSKDEDAG